MFQTCQLSNSFFHSDSTHSDSASLNSDLFSFYQTLPPERFVSTEQFLFFKPMAFMDDELTTKLEADYIEALLHAQSSRVQVCKMCLFNVHKECPITWSWIEKNLFDKLLIRCNKSAYWETENHYFKDFPNHSSFSYNYVN